MATWIVHLRIAEYIADKFNISDKYEFFAGNLAPDCGYGEKDSFGKFEPPPNVTHWTATGSKKDCRYKDFYNEYLKGKTKDKAYAFYLGYYLHLITDIMWSTGICLPTYTDYAEEYNRNSEFLRTIKLDWNDHDFRFLDENPDFMPYKLLDENKEDIADYLPYYEHNQLTKQIRFILDCYKNPITERDIYREYKYLTKEKLEDFMKTAFEMTEIDLLKKKLI